MRCAEGVAYMEDIAWRGGGGVTGGRRRAGAARGRSDPNFNFNAQQPPASMFVDRGRPQEALRTLFKVPTYPYHPPLTQSRWSIPLTSSSMPRGVAESIWNAPCKSYFAGEVLSAACGSTYHSAIW